MREIAFRASSQAAILRIGLCESFTTIGQTRRIIDGVSARFPELGPRVQVIDTFAEQLVALERGEIHAAFVHLPVPSHFHAVPLVDERRVACLAATDPLAQRKSLRLADLAQHEVVTMVPESFPEGRAPQLHIRHRVAIEREGRAPYDWPTRGSRHSRREHGSYVTDRTPTDQFGRSLPAHLCFVSANCNVADISRGGPQPVLFARRSAVPVTVAVPVAVVAVAPVGVLAGALRVVGLALAFAPVLALTVFVGLRQNRVSSTCGACQHRCHLDDCRQERSRQCRSTDEYCQFHARFRSSGHADLLSVGMNRTHPHRRLLYGNQDQLPCSETPSR
ncbi:LysR substrate-binding domain-containing protein [Nocardia sp. NPDC058705]|uniref:LysR substrate-binding domain-containing protein n=1 Tax=Nocardia sp. NPDC058705 TaxID=3346609 RepID=UPI0036C09194